MARFALLLAALLTITPTTGAAGRSRQELIDHAAIQRIRDEGLSRSRVEDTLFWLTDRYGPRLHASPEFEEAGEWAARQLREWGLSNVRQERFRSGPGWSLAAFHATMVAPRVMPMIGLPRARTAGTEGPVTADVIRPRIATPADAEQYRGKLRGKFVLVEPVRVVRMLEHGDGTVLRYDDDNGRWRREALGEVPSPAPAVVAAAAPPPAPPPSAAAGGPFRLHDFYREEGVVALFSRGPASDLAAGGSGLSWTQQRTDGGTLFVEDGASGADPASGVPEIVLAVEHYNRMVRLVDRGVPVTVELNVGVRWTPETTPRGFNILGEITGSDKADEVVLLGAHFDSWHGATGATDNAAGVTAMMEALRILNAAGLAPRRTIRLGLWGDEEGGLIGSRTYATTHLGIRAQPTPAFDRLSAYFNLDNGTGRIRGVWTQGNRAAQSIFEAWAAPLADLGVDIFSPRSVGQTDHVPFDALGVPAFQFVQERYEYNSRTHHSNMDFLDRVAIDDVKQMAVVVAVFAWHAAMREDRLPRLSDQPVTVR